MLKSIYLISEPFYPIDIDKSSNDDRKLGIILVGVFLINETEIVKKFINNIFFEHDIGQIESFIKKYSFSNDNISYIGGFGNVVVDRLTNNPNGKLNFNDQLVFFSHRSGWSYVVDSLLKFHNENGVKFEGFLENPFIWNRDGCLKEGEIPFKKDWVGVIHNPWDFPTENNEKITTKDLINSDVFRESLKTCRGLYVLSNYLRNKIIQEINVPVDFLYHPTEFVTDLFSIEKFRKNKNKNILEIGSWLRKMNSLFLLEENTDIWKKLRIIPSLLNYEKMIKKIENEKQLFNLTVTSQMKNRVEYIQPLSDRDYDNFLTENVVFIDLYESSANNTIVECLARGTPLLINKLPAVVEYLGEDYPFYFDTLEEASFKINNLDLIEQTHVHMMNNPIRNCITIYKNL
jgi:hypothetical protein